MCGGVDFSFVHSVNRDVALHYASGNQIGTLVQIRMGMIDRGAEISWLSQYPHEKEILFAPMTAFEVVSKRVEGKCSCSTRG